MKARRVRLLVVVATAALATGVWGYHKYSQKGIASPGRPVIFYGESGTPSEKMPALSRAETKKILDRVATKTRDPVWLIWVRPSQVYDAYVVPDKATHRMRTGRAYGMRKSEQEMRIGSGGKYIQICSAGRSFTRKLVKPSVADMPFDVPTVVDPNSGENIPMSEDDVIAVADSVRQQASSSRILSVSWNIESYPILGIARKGNIIHVQLGFMHDALWGSGVDIEIEQTPTGYKVLDWSNWIS